MPQDNQPDAADHLADFDPDQEAADRRAFIERSARDRARAQGDAEQDEIEHAIVRRKNQLTEEMRLAKSNRSKGRARPRAGDVLHVTLGRGLARRSRAGCTFGRLPGGASHSVTVLGDPHEDVLARQKKGELVVTLHGAEMLLDDDCLVVHGEAVSADIETERAARKQVEVELAAARAELAALREARMNAPESKDGRPSRLPAARAAAAAAAGAADPRSLGKTAVDPDGVLFPEDGAKK